MSTTENFLSLSLFISPQKLFSNPQNFSSSKKKKHIKKLRRMVSDVEQVDARKCLAACSNNIVQHAAVVIGLKISSCAFWLKTFFFSLLSIFYQMILMCGERGGLQHLGEEGGCGCFGKKKYIFALKILIAFGSSILHNILFLCREIFSRANLLQCECT